MTTQVSNAQAEYPQSPPPFLSGVPMVNPGGYTAPPSNMQLPQAQVASQPASSPQFMPQAQSVVSNMAAYSSSKYFLNLY